MPQLSTQPLAISVLLQHQGVSQHLLRLPAEKAALHWVPEVGLPAPEDRDEALDRLEAAARRGLAAQAKQVILCFFEAACKRWKLTNGATEGLGATPHVRLQIAAWMATCGKGGACQIH